MLASGIGRTVEEFLWYGWQNWYSGAVNRCCHYVSVSSSNPSNSMFAFFIILLINLSSSTSCVDLFYPCLLSIMLML